MSDTDALDRLTQAVERQTELLGQIASTLFDIASQGESEDEGERRHDLDGNSY